jgi:hypothetical protein
MTRSKRPIYVSKPQGKNIWQEYRVFEDRIELDFKLWGTVTVPMDQVEGVRVARPLVVFDLFRGELDLGDLLRTAKLDFADLAEHVSIEKDTGFWRQFRITPDDPEAFVAAVERARGQS